MHCTEEMRVIVFANNWVGWKITEWLSAHADTEIVGLVLHAQAKQKYAQEILQSVRLNEDRIFDGSRLHEPETIATIQSLRAEIGVSALFGYILKKDVLNLFPHGCINVHPAYLPWNRGSYPNVWSIVEGTPAGATVHYIDEGIDTGDVIARKQVTIDVTDTGESLYHKLEQACVDLFLETWPKIVDGTAERIPQSTLEEGTTHQCSDVDAIDQIDLQKQYSAEELFDIIRARTFPPYKGAYFLDKNGDRVYVRSAFHRETV